PADFTLGAHQAIFKAKKAKGSSEFKVVAPAVVTPPPGQPPVTTPPATPPAGQPPVTPPAGQPPVTPPTGQPPVTPPTSEPPVTTPPTGQPPVTPPPAGQPPVTTPPAGEPSTTTGTPARDGKGNILANTGVAGAPVGVLVGATLLAAAGVLLIGRRKRTSAS
ncbi:MAG: LPXTG cell wall anchor domain-containing protein, partial [Microbacteriaceae bacterium]|nr:LPXTG cell wall anchor domain-containing protein [Microbacteriaceae bacterium]